MPEKEKLWKHDKQIVISNPYDYFYMNSVSENDDIEIIIDDERSLEYNPVNYKKHIDEWFSYLKKNKTDWIYKAAHYDPAFMIDPINDYYKKLIKEDIRKKLPEEKLDEIIALIDPVTWCEKNLLQKHGGYKPRVSKEGIPYQAMIIRSTSKRLVMRAGRRIGKSAAVVARLLYKAFTFSGKKKPKFNIIVFTPNLAQVKMFFKLMEVFIDNNPVLLDMVKDGKIPTRQQPNMTLELTNGVTFIGFVGGSEAVRGSAADILYIDEASYLDERSTAGVIPMINDNQDVELCITSTPKGIKDWFYDRCVDPDFIDFHFPSPRYHPYWSSRMESEFRSQLNEADYNHEVEADFAADAHTVFQPVFVNQAVRDYEMRNQTRNKDCYYGIGVDWNSEKNGTQIKVVEYDPDKKLYTVVDSDSVSIAGWTQMAAVERIAQLNRKWLCNFVYVDEGYGATQIEELHRRGRDAEIGSHDRYLVNVRGVNFSSKAEVHDPWTKQIQKKEVKVLMVNQAVRIFENGYINIPRESNKLIAQLQGYHIVRYKQNGSPVYEPDERWGDHELDALMIALYGFLIEYSTLTKPIMVTDFTSVKHPLRNDHYVAPLDPATRRMVAQEEKLQRMIAEDEKMGQGSTGTLFDPVVSFSRPTKPPPKRRSRSIGSRTIF